MMLLIISSAIFIAISILLVMVRMWLGPTLSDRVMALDTFTTVTVAVLALLSLYLKRLIYMDIALVYAAIGFIGTVFVAKFIEKDI